MQVYVASQSDGNIQFVVHAETDAERVVLAVFERQVREGKLWLHGFTHKCDGKGLGPASFNVGTVPKEGLCVTSA